LAISVFDLFKIGIGPSSSHTVGPMRAAGMFVEGLADSGLSGTVSRLQVELFGSLGATGKGHGTDKALLLGLQGEVPEQVDTDSIPARIEQVRSSGRLLLPGNLELALDVDKDLIFHRRKVLPYHPNGMIFHAFDNNEQLLLQRSLN